ncbi:MAG: GrpB family protein [Candidatus Bathyarchaeota archaeon]|nr:GrpB family protein [Candidatus Bathyarchaeota archaeon]
MPRPVVIVPYDPEWPKIYDGERKLILSTTGGIIRSIEHIGSTSVPGLWAKPIIDIIAGVNGPDDAERCRELLLHIGYDDASSGDNPDWYYCLGKGSHSPGFHLHLVKEGSQFHWKHILFRDWLRAHPADAEAYKELKLGLSEKYRNDRVAYTDSKTEFIEEIVEKAKKPRA